MQFSFKAQGRNKVSLLQEKLKQQAAEDVQAWMDLVLEFIQDKMAEPKTGREYKLPNGSTYVASAPGEYPGIKTGALITDIQVKTTKGSNQYITKFELGTNIPHGAILELKAQEGKAGGRFWLNRAFKENEDLLIDSLRKLGAEVDGNY